MIAISSVQSNVIGCERDVHFASRIGHSNVMTNNKMFDNALRVLALELRVQA
jgi:hypothetical protein